MQAYCDYCRRELYAGHEANCPYAPAHENFKRLHPPAAEGRATEEIPPGPPPAAEIDRLRAGRDEAPTAPDTLEECARMLLDRAVRPLMAQESWAEPRYMLELGAHDLQRAADWLRKAIAERDEARRALLSWQIWWNRHGFEWYEAMGLPQGAKPPVLREGSAEYGLWFPAGPMPAAAPRATGEGTADGR